MPEIGGIISHYRIIEKLGQGGMGKVFLAHDTSLDRKVALKFLTDIFSGDPERLARFEREAKLLASLNHPNIATIYGLEQADGKRFLAMELVEGEILAQQIERGPLPVDDALEICRQIAEGLEAAHEKGVIHRDLKPANVKITREGKFKVLDFGLAKALQDETPAVDVSKSPTLTDQMTRAGVILGTAAYMSPEQARGAPVDKRADIWAFGVILIELLTGRCCFPGDTVTDVLAAVVKSEPDWTALPTDTPDSVRQLLRRCLTKDRKQRLRDIGDARIEIGEPTTHSSETVPTPWRFPLLWLAAVAAVVFLAGILAERMLTKSSQTPIPASVVTATIKVEPGHWLDGMRYSMQRPSRTAMAISSNGKFIVYSAIEENPGPQAKPRLYLRRMD
jgi:serine/threonine protein kinase